MAGTDRESNPHHRRPDHAVVRVVEGRHSHAPRRNLANRPVNLHSAADSRRRALDWGIVGTVVAVVSILAAMGSWIQVARRPVPTPGPVPQTRRFHVDTASEPGPSERVRELVRRNPEAAASVLQRWTGQGGRV